MIKLLHIALAAASLAPALSHGAIIKGDVTGGGSFAGTVTNSGAWVQSNVTNGDQVNFWTFTGQAGQAVSIVVASTAIDFGISLYQGLVSDFDVFSGNFLNDASFGGVSFLKSTNPVTGSSGAAGLYDFTLNDNGIYTIALGGVEFPGDDGSFAYTMRVQQVPLPAVSWLLLSGLGLMVGVRRFRAVT